MSVAVTWPWAFLGPRAAAAEAGPPRSTMKTATGDEIELLARIATGDRGAFRAFYDRFAAQVLAYVRSLSRDRSAAEDVVQEVFLAVWRKAASFRPERGDVAGWLYTITRNKLVDLWRRGGAEQTAEDLDPARLPEAERPESAELRLAVTQVLAELSADQRRAVEMAYFGGLTYEETAARLAIPLGTLKSRIRSALLEMRARLGGGRHGQASDV